ncbi:TRAP transporter small permease [Thermodesulfobacteriota bacterium]
MKAIHFLSKVTGYVATVVLGLMMLLTVADVFLRYFFNSPITGTTEMTELMLVVVVFPAFAWCAIQGRHVKVDLIVALFPPRIQVFIDSFTLLATLGIYIVITWQSFFEAMETHTATSLIGLPHAPFYWIMAFGFVLFCLSILSLVIEKIFKEVIQ